jgi:hypothetical protein
VGAREHSEAIFPVCARDGRSMSQRKGGSGFNTHGQALAEVQCEAFGRMAMDAGRNSLKLEKLRRHTRRLSYERNDTGARDDAK